jgi:uncharacterized protein (DUF1015 family)
MSEPYTKPFKGMIFNREKIDDISQCVCPPYDVISSVRSYYVRSLFNAIRLELPMPLPSMNKYSVARETLEGWLKKGILVRDNKETIYIYEQEFEVEQVTYLRRGFIALNKLEKKRILTHEETRKKAKEDREMLISTLKTYTSLIFGLYEDKQQEIENILIGSEKDKIYDFVDEQSIINRFYRMTDIEEMKKLILIMEEKNIYIADGHHRLDVSYKLNIPYIPLYLTNMYSEGIVILPYHRTIKFQKNRNLNELLKSMEGFIDIEKYPLLDNNSTKIALQKIFTPSKSTFILYSKDDLTNLYILTEKAPFSFTNNDVHEGLKKLKVNVLHSGIVKKLLNIKEEEISFTQDPYKAITQIKEGALDLALFLPPTKVEEVRDIAENGLYMPPKSTFFYPKILTGLVFYKYE